MLEILQTGKALYVLAVIGMIGVLSKLVTRSLYKRLIRETDNMAMTKNRNLKILKQKLENACRLNQSIVNTEAYLERQMYGFRFLRVSLQGWNNVSLQMTILGIMAGGAASFASYWYRLDSYYIVLYASAGAFLGLFLAFLESSFNIGLKQQRLSNALLEYADNSVFVRAAREGSVRDEHIQDNVRRLPIRDLSGDITQERERLIRENDLRDGLIREAVKASAQGRGQTGQDRLPVIGERVDKPAGLKRLKAEKLGKARKGESGEAAAGNEGGPGQGMEQTAFSGGGQGVSADLLSGIMGDGAEDKGLSGRGGARGAGLSGKAGTIKKTLSPGKELSGSVLSQEAGEGTAGGEAGARGDIRRTGSVRDIDYLKRSLEQIAASREKSKREEDWTRDLSQEEMKVLGELIRQYFSAD